MPSDIPQSTTASHADLDKVTLALPPDWVVSHPAPESLPRKDGDHITQLLIDQQHNRSEQTVYSRSILRLESMDAVQHLSQWTLDFSPKTQTIILHDLSVMRNGERKQYALKDNIRLLNRERNLEAFIVDGVSTLLIVLADIRVGDTIEASFTIVTRPYLLEEDYFHFYALPQNTQIGQLYYSVIAPTGQLPEWKSSDSMGSPEQTTSNGNDQLSWKLEGVSRFENEPNVPSWYLPPAWIQLSTISSWKVISSAAAKAWPDVSNCPELDACIADIQSAHPTLEEQIEAALRLVQDDFRYLSIVDDVGGQIPAHPKLVLERRYGDCKDLSLLATSLLNKLGVKARPVAVSSGVGKSIPQMLPSLNLFNHAIVSFFYEDKEYWVDATLSSQGGGFRKRSVGNFYQGLPIEVEGSDLQAQPANKAHDSYRIKDTLLIDTRGDHSLLRVQIVATGSYADTLRKQLVSNGESGFKQYLTARTKDRYNVQEQIENPLYEDDRVENTWRMVEQYKLPVLYNPTHSYLDFTLPECLPLALMHYPESNDRTTPLAFPNNVDIKHTVEIPGTGKSPNQHFRSERVEYADILYAVKANIDEKLGWKCTITLRSKSDHIPPDKITEYKATFLQALNNSTISLHLAKGYARPHRPDDFNSMLAIIDLDEDLPAPQRQKSKKITPQRQYGREYSSSSSSSRARSKSSKSRRRDEGERDIPLWLLGIGTLAIVGTIAAAIAFLTQ